MAFLPTPPKKEEPRRGGLLGIYDIATHRNASSGLNPLQEFAAGLDAMIMPEMRMGGAIRQQGASNVARNKKNSTVEMLRTQGRDDLADAVERGTIDFAQAFGVMQSDKASDKAFQRQKDLAGYKAGLATKKTSVDIDKYNLAKSQGFEGSYIDFEKALNGFEPSAGLEELDKTFAKTLDNTSAFSLSAARQDTASVASVLEKLEAGEKLTGPMIGLLPENLRAFVAPDSVQAQQLVEQVVQKNLRAILGGQFAQKEGEQLVKRAYNPTLPPEENARRLRALLLTLDVAAKSKQDQADYFRKNNYSLRGYSGFSGVPTVDDFMSALDADIGGGGGEGGSDTVKRLVYNSKGELVSK